MAFFGLAARAGGQRRRSSFVRASVWAFTALVLLIPAGAWSQPPGKGDRGPLTASSAYPDGSGAATDPAEADADAYALNERKLDAPLRAWTRQSSDSNNSNGPSSTRAVIITIASDPPDSSAAVSALISKSGGRVKQMLSGVNAVVADVPPGLLRLLARDSRVVSISTDAAVRAIDGNMIASSGATVDGASLRDALGLPPSNPPASTDGAGVAIVDSGISPSADFVGRITAFYDFTRGGVATTAVDPYGHGTHVAGIIGSSGATSSHEQYGGIASNARLIGLRVLDENGAGQTSDVIQAIEFAIAQRDALGIDIINLSLGHPIYESAASDPLVRAVERAVDAGIVVVTSAGNFGYNRELDRSGYAGITSPGNAPSAITAGALRGADTATRDDDDVAPYSSRGPSWYDGFAKPDLLAPGHGIVSNGPSTSMLYTDYPSVRAGSSFMRLNGTSMAAAATTGVIALMIDAHKQTQASGPALAPNAIKAILQYTSTPLAAVAGSGSGSPDALTQGAGAINAPAAIDAARAIDTRAALGDDWFDGSRPPFTIYKGEVWSWNTSVMWGETPLSGDTLIEFHQPAWTTAANWGQPLEWSSDVVSKQNVVWDTVIDWASNVVWGTNLVGTTTDDQTFTLGYVEDPLRTVWGDLSKTVTGGQTFCWGDTSSVPTRSR